MVQPAIHSGGKRISLPEPINNVNYDMPGEMNTLQLWLKILISSILDLLNDKLVYKVE